MYDYQRKQAANTPIQVEADLQATKDRSALDAQKAWLMQLEKVAIKELGRVSYRRLAPGSVLTPYGFEVEFDTIIWGKKVLCTLEVTPGQHTVSWWLRSGGSHKGVEARANAPANLKKAGPVLRKLMFGDFYPSLQQLVQG
jgi:hypothetical protein